MAIFPFHNAHASLREIEKSVNSDILKQKNLVFSNTNFLFVWHLFFFQTRSIFDEETNTTQIVTMIKARASSTELRQNKVYSQVIKI